MSSRGLIASLFLFFIPVIALASSGCPSVADISRTSGEFSWISKAPGWTGHFALPQQGKGYSTHIKHFMEARWIQLNNLEKSQGYFECDYQGNYGDEVIRFVLAGTQAYTKPTDPHWSCELNPQFPAPQCLCGASPELCALEHLSDGPAPTPIIITPEITEPHTLPPLPEQDIFKDK